MNESHRSCFDEDGSSLETNESSRGPYDILTIEGKILLFFFG